MDNVYGKMMEEHNERLHKVFKRLTEVVLKEINASSE